MPATHEIDVLPLADDVLDEAAAALALGGKLQAAWRHCRLRAGHNENQSAQQQGETGHRRCIAITVMDACNTDGLLRSFLVDSLVSAKRAAHQAAGPRKRRWAATATRGLRRLALGLRNALVFQQLR